MDELTEAQREEARSFVSALEEGEKMIEEEEEVEKDEMAEILAILSALYLLHQWDKDNPTPYGQLDRRRLMEQLTDIAGRASRKKSKLVKTALDDIAKDSFEGTMANIKRQKGEKYEGKRLDNMRLREVVDAPRRGLSLDERIAENAARTSIAIRAILIDGITQGKSPGEMIKEIKKRKKRERDNLATITRDEVAHAFTQAQLVAMHDEGIKKVEFVAVLDGQTTQECRRLDGKQYAIDRAPIPPLHYGCRSILVPVV